MKVHYENNHIRIIFNNSPEMIMMTETIVGVTFVETKTNTSENKESNQRVKLRFFTKQGLAIDSPELSYLHAHRFMKDYSKYLIVKTE